MAAVGIARMALTDAAQAVLQARLARIQAGEDQPDAAATDGHVPLHGRNPVSRHGPALAHGVSGEIKYVLTRPAGSPAGPDSLWQQRALSVTPDLTDLGRSGYSGRAIPTPYGDGPAQRD